MKIHIGNLSDEFMEESLRLTLEQFGEVKSVTIMKDKHGVQPKRFGFVEMPSKAEGQAAIDGLNGKEVKGSPLTLSVARPRVENRSGGKIGFGKGGYGSSAGGQSPGKGRFIGGRGGQGGSRGGYGGGRGSQGRGR